MTIDTIPQDLKSQALWCLWKYEERGDRRTKMPYSPLGGNARSNDPETFTGFEQALTAYKRGGYDGLGMGIFNGFCAVDIDHCLDLNAPEGYKLSDMAQDIINTMDSYTEMSPSGTGIRILFKATGFQYDKAKYYINNRNIGLEVYIEGATSKYVTVTGMQWGEWGRKPVKECSEQIAVVLEKYMRRKDRQPTTPTYTSTDAPDYLQHGLEKDERLLSLWNGHRDTTDESGNDLALLNKLAYWCNRDEGKMIEAFLQSPYAAQKDDAHRKKMQREDYLHSTAQMAIAGCQRTAADDDAAYKLERARRVFSSATPCGNVYNIEPADYSDAGNAAVFSNVYAGKLLYADSLGWLWWDGKKWDRSDHHATRCALELSEDMYLDALSKYSEAKHAAAQADIDFASEKISKSDRDKAKDTEASAKAYFKHASTTRNATRINNLISLSIPSFLIKADQLDANPFDLNTPAGIIDLRTGNMRKHDPKAYCTQITACSPGTEGADMWDEFMDWVTGGDHGVREYLQMVAGMAAVGEIYQEGVVMAYGPGGNGKSTFVNTVGNVLGEYSGSIAIKILTTERQNSGPALATMRGKRLVVAGELEENQRLSVSTLKQLASTDKLVIEEKYHAPEVVKQTHTLVLFTNHLPRVGSTDGGTWRRLTVVPFLSKVQPDKNILNYTEALTNNAGEAILSWVIQGAVKFCANNFKIPLPDAVAKATEEYQARENWLSNFIAERCTRAPNGRVQSSALYSAYREWSQSTGDYTRRLNDFSTAMEAAGFMKIAPKGTKYWQGISLNPVPMSDYGYRDSHYSY